MNKQQSIKKQHDLRHKKRRKDKHMSIGFPEVDGAERQIKQLDKSIKIHKGKLEQARAEKKKLEALVKGRE
jgi:hypothetical protein